MNTSEISKLREDVPQKATEASKLLKSGDEHFRNLKRKRKCPSESHGSNLNT